MSRGRREQRGAGFDETAVRDALDAGLATTALTIDDAKRAVLVAYLRMLVTWNRAYALSGIREPLRMVSTHLLDSLVVLPHLEGTRCIDIGTGAGLPGLVLAIADPAREWTLLDASAKKVAFCRQAGFELGLSNIHARHGRIEQLGMPGAFDTATTRATFPPEESAELAHECLAEGGRLICMRGEADPARDYTGYGPAHLHETPVPGADRRHLLVMRRLAADTTPTRHTRENDL